AIHYPNLPKSALFPIYIATRSGHSRGATLDLTIVKLGSEPPAKTETATPLPGTVPQQGPGSDGSIDMGTSFDCFDVEANTAAAGLTREEQEKRATLAEAMRARGLKQYP